MLCCASNSLPSRHSTTPHALNVSCCVRYAEQLLVVVAVLPSVSLAALWPIPTWYSTWFTAIGTVEMANISAICLGQKCDTPMAFSLPALYDASRARHVSCRETAPPAPAQVPAAAQLRWELHLSGRHGMAPEGIGFVLGNVNQHMASA